MIRQITPTYLQLALTLGILLCVSSETAQASRIPTDIHYQSPISIDDDYIKKFGNVVSGYYQGTVNTPAISIKTSQPVTIQNSILVGPGDLIAGPDLNLTVVNTYGYGINPNKIGVPKGKFIMAQNVINLRVEHCYINTGGGIIVMGYDGNHTSDQTIKILNNSMENIDGRPSNGHGGYQQNDASVDKPTSAIALNNVLSVPDIEIAWNQVINQPYDSEVGDNVNIYLSSGTASSHLMIHDNYIQGAYSPNPGQFPQSYSGGGMITDGIASNAASATAYVDIFNNQIVSTANYGMALAGGHDNSIFNNRVVSSGYVINSTTQKTVLMPLVNAGSYYNSSDQPKSVYYNNHIHDNYGCEVGRDSRDPTGNTPELSDWGLYLPGQNNNMENNMLCHVFPTTTDEISEYYNWKNKVIINNEVIGPVWGLTDGRP